MKKTLFVFLVLALALGTYNCKKPSQKIIGSWERTLDGDTYVATFSDGGTYTVSINGDTFSDSYTLTDSEIMIYSGDCGSTGTYKYTVKSKDLTFTMVSDNCSERAHVIDGDWKKK
jgi:hypothetical protein